MLGPVVASALRLLPRPPGSVADLRTTQEGSDWSLGFWRGPVVSPRLVTFEGPAIRPAGPRFRVAQPAPSSPSLRPRPPGPPSLVALSPPAPGPEPGPGGESGEDLTHACGHASCRGRCWRSKLPAIAKSSLDRVGGGAEALGMGFELERRGKQVKQEGGVG